MPKNTQFYTISLDELNKIISDKLGFKVKIRNPYKLCDFKPTYGYIFEKYIKSFDFWGYSDIDVLFGNIRAHITNEVLEHHEIITTKTENLSGHFTLFRNTDLINTLFMKSPQYRNILKNKSYRGFDEKYNLTTININQNKLRYYILRIRDLIVLKAYKVFRLETKIKPDSQLDSMSKIVLYLSSSGQIRTYMKRMMETDLLLKKANSTNWQIEWNEGRISLNERELMYFHFYYLKHDEEFKIQGLDHLNLKKFHLNPNRIEY
ncbi:hypothetical protein ES705_14370 [subsurface metagenome]